MTKKIEYFFKGKLREMYRYMPRITTSASLGSSCTFEKEFFINTVSYGTPSPAFLEFAEDANGLINFDFRWVFYCFKVKYKTCLNT